MITKELLENVVLFEYDMQESALHGNYDIYTLRFRQWWKKDIVIKFHRKIVEYHDNGGYTHQQSKESLEFHQMLKDHIAGTFEQRPQAHKAKVLSLVKNNLNR